MKISQKPALTPPTASKGVTKAHSSSSNSSQSVAVIAMNMAWQLAIVVIAPIVGGHFLDVHYNTSPAWTVAGLVLSIAAMIVVIYQTLQALNEVNGANDTEAKQ